MRLNFQPNFRLFSSQLPYTEISDDERPVAALRRTVRPNLISGGKKNLKLQIGLEGTLQPQPRRIFLSVTHRNSIHTIHAMQGGRYRTEIGPRINVSLLLRILQVFFPLCRLLYSENCYSEGLLVVYALER